RDLIAAPGERFVDGVVHDLVDQVVQRPQVGAADVHAGPQAHRLQALERVNRTLVVSGLLLNLLCHAVLQHSKSACLPPDTQKTPDNGGTGLDNTRTSPRTAPSPRRRAPPARRPSATSRA